MQYLSDSFYLTFPRDRVFVNGTIRYDEFTDGDDNLVRTTTILASEYMLAMGIFTNQWKSTTVTKWSTFRF